MEGFTIVDGIVAAVIVISAILAHSRGLVREIMAIAGWIAAAILAFIFAPAAEPIVREIPVVGDYLQDSCELSIIAAFAVVFALALLLVSVFTPLFSSAVQRSALSGADQALGFLFGALRGVILVAVAFLIYDRAAVGEAIAAVENSRSAVLFERSQARIDDSMPEDAPGWIVARYEELTGVCNPS
jgi:membrane protein required for colicin V production